MSVTVLVHTAIFAGVILAGVMIIAWLVQLRTGNSGWIDVGWTLGMGLAGVLGAWLQVFPDQTFTIRRVLVAGLAAFWALRLVSHVLRRTLRSSDDPRYAKLKAQWGATAPLFMLGMALFQAVVSLPLALAIILAAHNPAPQLTIQDAIACVLLAVAVLGEGLADRTLRHFSADPANKGRVCDVGLWAWSRHPNYFFEWLGWVAYPLFAITPDGTYPFGWLALGAPVLMYVLLAHVSGVPPLEQHMLESRGDLFRRYQARTNRFFPFPPRREQN